MSLSIGKNELEVVGVCGGSLAGPQQRFGVPVLLNIPVSFLEEVQSGHGPSNFVSKVESGGNFYNKILAREAHEQIEI